VSTFDDFMIDEAVKKDKELRHLTALARLGVILAKRITTYFPPVDQIDKILDCDIEIRKMADAVLEKESEAIS
jgi:hypothetical protein